MLQRLVDDLTRVREMIARGVILDDCATCYIENGVVIGDGAHLEPNVTIFGRSVIGAGARIGNGCRITDSEIGDRVVVKISYIENSKVGADTTVGPFAYLRGGADIGAGCRVGDFVEIKNATLHDGVKAAHLSYIGDAEVGEATNVGCGTVFANYNGKIKQRSTVGKHVFIGCNTNLVAPVSVGDDSYIAAGSTVTEDVPPRSLCIARERQIIKENWRK